MSVYSCGRVSVLAEPLSGRKFCLLSNGGAFLFVFLVSLGQGGHPVFHFCLLSGLVYLSSQNRPFSSSFLSVVSPRRDVGKL